MQRIVVTGAYGRMGREVLRAIWGAEDKILVGAVDAQGEGTDAGHLIGVGEVGVIIKKDMVSVLKETSPDVMVDFTGPRSVFENAKTCLGQGVRPVIGTTGLSAGEINEIIGISERAGVGGLIAPNFAIGAILMMKFAREAARFLPHVEIIELHHDQKQDAPSGTAIKTAELISAARGDFRQGLASEMEKIPGARGGEFDGGIRIHSVRLPGLVAHQEVIFGGLGQTLTIRHDSISRESFMPGVLLAIAKVMKLERVVYGLENLLFEEF